MAPQDDLTAERAAKCTARVYDRWRIDVSGHLCSKKAKVEVDGKWYCGVHDPEAVKRREKASYDRYKKQFENPLKYTEKDYQAALKTARQEALREQLNNRSIFHGSYNGGWTHDDETNKAFHHGVDVVFDMLKDELDRLASEGGLGC